MKALWLAALAAAPVSAQTRAVAPAEGRLSLVSPVVSGAPALTPLNAPALSFSAPSPSFSVPHAAALDSPGPLPAAASAELAHASGAGLALSRRAEDVGAARGLKGRAMSGADFISMVDDAGRALDAESASAPSPEAAQAARRVRAAMARVVRALVPEDKPFLESAPRAVSVWQVFNQEMANAARKGTLAAVADDAELFASQVEESVAPAPEPEEQVHPEDPEGYGRIAEPGSIFGWKPIEDSPGHGLAPLDALIRRALSEKASPARAAGFVLRGAEARADARLFFYGERHTDAGLILENMRRLVEDARPGRPMIVLVEGYTGWPLRGWEALKYLADRGLDTDAFAARDLTSAFLEVRGWDTAAGYDASKHPLLQHHMDMLALNHLAWSEARGWRYYRDAARAAWTAWKGRRELWKVAVQARNLDLDRAVARAAADTDANGGTVHVIAGSDHLLESPRLNAALPRLFPPSFRRSLAAAAGGRPFWASKPAETAAP